MAVNLHITFCVCHFLPHNESLIKAILFKVTILTYHPLLICRGVGDLEKSHYGTSDPMLLSIEILLNSHVIGSLALACDP